MRTFTVPSQRNPDAVYTVRVYIGTETEFGQNEWSCNCANWYYRHNTPDYKPCTHIDYARQAFADGLSGGSATNPFPLKGRHESH